MAQEITIFGGGGGNFTKVIFQDGIPLHTYSATMISLISSSALNFSSSAFLKGSTHMIITWCEIRWIWTMLEDTQTTDCYFIELLYVMCVTARYHDVTVSERSKPRRSDLICKFQIVHKQTCCWWWFLWASNVPQLGIYSPRRAWASIFPPKEMYRTSLASATTNLASSCCLILSVFGNNELSIRQLQNIIKEFYKHLHDVLSGQWRVVFVPTCWRFFSIAALCVWCVELYVFCYPYAIKTYKCCPGFGYSRFNILSVTHSLSLMLPKYDTLSTSSVWWPSIFIGLPLVCFVFVS